MMNIDSNNNSSSSSGNNNNNNNNNIATTTSTISLLSPSNGICMKWITSKTVKLGEKLVGIREVYDNNNDDIMNTDDNNNENREEITYLLSKCSGKIVKTLIDEGQQVYKDVTVMAIVEPCKHPALFKSLCVSCGEVIIRDNNNNSNNSNSNSKDQKKTASLIVGSGKHLLQLDITSQEAQKIQESKISTLCNQNKLALVLDIDHTILHATPSIGPPTAAILDEGIVHLPILEDPPNNSVKHHLVKLRPHIHHFLAEASKICQITIYTAATRKYAEAVVKVLDPNGTYFSHRIVSRSDNPNDGTLGLDKSLHRIFLDDSGMALIMDDREDVWKGAQGHQLLLVKPFIYFRNGIEVNNAAGPSGALGNVTRQLSNMEPIIKLSGDTPGSRVILPLEQQENINASDHDDQLLQSLKHLKEIHANFFDMLKKKNSINDQSSTISPNTGNILTNIKKSLLAGCTVTFSGLIPKNEMNPENHHLWKLATSLGAQVSFDLCSRTTHLITTQTQTEKVKECLQRGDVWVLHPDWLTYCRWSLTKALESTFLIIPPAAGKAFPNPILDTTPLPPQLTTFKSTASPLILTMTNAPPDITPLSLPPTNNNGTGRKRVRDTPYDDDNDNEGEYLENFRETPKSNDDNDDDNNRISKKIKNKGNISFQNFNNGDDYDTDEDDYEYNNQNNSYQRFMNRKKSQSAVESDSSDGETFGDFDKMVASRR